MIDNNNDLIPDGYNFHIEFLNMGAATQSVVILLCFEVDLTWIVNADFKAVLPIKLNQVSSAGIGQAVLNG